MFLSEHKSLFLLDKYQSENYLILTLNFTNELLNCCPKWVYSFAFLLVFYDSFNHP